jgi:peptide/nickel transport system substrate-binding protein
MHDVGERPMPGTGPYEIASVDDRRIRFVRNPRFREWSRAAQPDGNANVIEWRFGMTPARQVREISAGRADFSDELPADLAAVARLRSGTMHSRAFPITGFVQLNTRRPPFNNLFARRAFNYAVDRARIAREFGGPLAARPTCQFLPPGVEGYRRYCPYTRDVSRDEGWTGPDLRRARALVKRSGTRGAAVTMLTVTDTGRPEPGTRYMVDMLRRLGYRAQLRKMTSQDIAHAKRAQRARMQLLEIVFGPAYPSAFAFFATFITCHGVFSWDQFCDPSVDRAVEQAQRLRLTDPDAAARRWATIDRALVDRAITVPLINVRIVDFTSKRLRAYQNSPIYQFLPAQAWLSRR